MRIDLLGRKAPVCFGGRVILQPGINQVDETDFAAVADCKLVRWYFDQKIAVIVAPESGQAPKESVAPVALVPPPTQLAVEQDQQEEEVTHTPSKRRR